MIALTWFGNGLLILASAEVAYAMTWLVSRWRLTVVGTASVFAVVLLVTCIDRIGNEAWWKVALPLVYAIFYVRIAKWLWRYWPERQSFRRWQFWPEGSSADDNKRG